ncbi:MAG: MerR family transcriptional regulator [Candidatus Saccharimonadales bacterium]
MKDFLSIKEFSELSGVESSALRYWDDLGFFMPARRDKHNRYRYYTPDQIIQVKFISVLNSLEIPLKTIAETERDRTPENILQLIEDQERLLETRARLIRERISVLNMRRQLIKRGLMSEKIGDVSVVDLETIHFVRGRRNEFDGEAGFYRPFVRFCRAAKDLDINLHLPIAGIHEDWAGFVDSPSEPHYWISLDPDGKESRARGNHMVGVVRGYYGDLGDIHTRMAEYAETHNIKTSGPVFTIYLHDEICVKGPSDYLTMVTVAIDG